MISVSNAEFLQAIFGEDYLWAHVTDFRHDPSAIPDDQILTSWRGNYFSWYKMRQNSNQYFTISLFWSVEKRDKYSGAVVLDDKGNPVREARRRKQDYRCTPCIVLDDVKEKLPMEEVEKLPEPSWILETSRGSEQWGYILTEPATNREQVENLLDGLVANGLAPSGKDPGMKGVTRYVRLPEGVNNKASKLIDGKPWKCRLTLWQPEKRVTLGELATPFSVNLFASREESSVDNAATISDHPFIVAANKGFLKIKQTLKPGTYDIECPWVDGHTDRADNGAAIFTNADGSPGFKCHHGHCEGRTAHDVIGYIDEQDPGFADHFKNWQFNYAMQLQPVEVSHKPVDVSHKPVEVSHKPVEVSHKPVDMFHTDATSLNITDTMMEALSNQIPNTPEYRHVVEQIIKSSENLSVIEKMEVRKRLKVVLNYNKSEFDTLCKEVLHGNRKNQKTEISFDSLCYVSEINQFYDYKKMLFLAPEAFQNTYSNVDEQIKLKVLKEDMIEKVDSLIYAPEGERYVTKGSRRYCNVWLDDGEKGEPGDPSLWLDHFTTLGWDEHREHVLQWMAYTLRNPQEKINHAIIFGGNEGTGKDWLLYPLQKGMGSNSTIIMGDALLDNFNDYLLNTKLLQVNETELGDRKEGKQISAKLKAFTAAPPDTLRINSKNIKAFDIDNIVNLVMTTNSKLPLTLSSESRRLLALWCKLTMTDTHGQRLPCWENYWFERWKWMRDGGYKHVLYYLYNEVDISNFDPGTPPPVTRWLKNILAESLDPLREAIYKSIGTGLITRDLTTLTEIEHILRMNADALKISTHGLSTRRIEKNIEDLGSCRVVEFIDPHGVTTDICILGNHQKYADLTPEQIYMEYMSQSGSKAASVTNLINQEREW